MDRGGETHKHLCILPALSVSLCEIALSLSVLPRSTATFYLQVEEHQFSVVLHLLSLYLCTLREFVSYQ